MLVHKSWVCVDFSDTFLKPSITFRSTFIPWGQRQKSCFKEDSDSRIFSSSHGHWGLDELVLSLPTQLLCQVSDAGPLQTSCPPRPRPTHWRDSWRQKEGRGTKVGVIFPTSGTWNVTSDLLPSAVSYSSPEHVGFPRGLNAANIFICSHYIDCFLSVIFHSDTHFPLDVCRKSENKVAEKRDGT